MIHVYYSSVGADSAKALVKQVVALAAATAHKQKDGLFEHRSNDLCVNWGARCPEPGGHWLNRAVQHNKLRQMERMRDAGVPTVEWAFERPARGFTWYARNIEHRDGSDLERHLVHGDYYVKHVDTASEFRVHVFGGEVLRASLKVRSDRFLEPGEKPGDVSKVFRIGNGWVFSERNWKDDVPAALNRAAVNAVAALRYDFGGVDVATTPAGGVVVFEVNSCPWLGGEMQRVYARRIVNLA